MIFVPDNDFPLAQTHFVDRLRDHMCDFPLRGEITFAETTYNGDVIVHYTFRDVTFVVTLRVDMTNCIVNRTEEI
jgi:hypothetical protein